MFGLDAAILLGWACWVFKRIDYRGPWGLWTTAQRKWYNEVRQLTGYGFPVQVYGTYGLIMDPALILAAWGHTRTYRDDETFYILTLVFLFVALAMDKIWRELHWDRRDPKAAMWIAWGLVCPAYICAAVFAGLTPSTGNEWQKWLLLGLCVVQTLWFGVNGFIDYQWKHVPGLGMTRKESRNHSDIKFRLK